MGGMTDTIGWGILATGGIAATFTEDLALLPDARVAAVGSRTPERARAFADRFDIPHAHGDWDGLVADDTVDIVYVANTHNGHYEAAKRCLEGGKAVLCEKPFTVNRAQAAELVDLARQRNLFLMEAMWMRCNPAIRQLRQAVADGLIGEVTSLNATFGLGGPFAPDHRLRDPHQAGGALLDLGVYPISLAHLMLGRPASVQATADLTAEGVDATTGILLGYDSGVVATLACSITSDMPITASVNGTTGHVGLPAPFFRPARYFVGRGGGEAEPDIVEVPHDGIGYVHQAIEAMRCLREGLTESPLVTWQDTLDVMAILDDVRSRIGVGYPGE